MSIPNTFDPLGTFLFDKLPPGYKPLEFVTFDGATCVDSEIPAKTPFWYEVDFQFTAYAGRNSSVYFSILGGSTNFCVPHASDWGAGQGKNVISYWRGSEFPFPDEYRFPCNLSRTKIECRFSNDDIYTAYNSEPLTRLSDEQIRNQSHRSYQVDEKRTFLIGGAWQNGLYTSLMKGLMFGMIFKNESGQVIADIRPALYNEFPCLYDVRRKFKLNLICGQLK